MTSFYRVEKITLKPLLVLARDQADVIRILSHSFATGMGHRPDADFEVVSWRPRKTSPRSPPLKWLSLGYRGIAWPVNDGRGWEMVQTDLQAP